MEQVDHINGIRHDNRWNNLREATIAENAQNRPYKTMKYTRIYLTTDGRGYKSYRCQVMCNRKATVKHFPYTDVGYSMAEKWVNETVTRLHGEYASQR